MTAPSTADTATCRSCGADVIWTVTAASRSRMPVDADPRPDGNIILAAGDPPVAHYLTDKHRQGQPELDVDGLGGRRRYVSHFATCPDRDDWRRP